MELLKKLWEGWKAFGRFLGNFVARVVLSIFYFTVFLPFGLGVTLFGDPLAIKTSSGSFWRPRKTNDQTFEDLTRQF